MTPKRTEPSRASAPDVRPSTFMGERMSIAQKLFVMLVVPVVALLVFSGLQTTDKLGVVRSMGRLEEITQLATEASALAHELQKERGRSTGHLARDSGESAELQAQRSRTDEAAGVFTESASGLELDGDLKRAVDGATQALQELASQRSLISSRSTSVAATLEFYGGLIDQLLSIVSAVAAQADDAHIALTVVALDSLAHLKELSGQERALLNAAFTSGSVTAAERRMAAANMGEQDGYEENFLDYATADASREYREKMSAAYVEEVRRMRDVAMGSSSDAAPTPAAPADPTAPAAPDGAAAPAPSDGTLGGVSAADWWRASTARIDALFEIEQVVASQVLEEVSSLRSGASWALVFFATLAVVSILGALFLAYFLAQGMIRSFAAASDTLQRVVGQIGSFVRQQSASTTETATSVSETTTTVEEIRKTAETADARGKDLSSVAQQSRQASDEALSAVGHGTEAMQHIRSEVESIAQNILELSEKNIQIGEIVQSVNAIAEQSNLLAVNASIEAAKAGDHGKGFSVVAAEVKALAQQSKEATDQIRAILAEIQKSSNGAVMITEQGVKRVEEGASLIEELGRTIRNLANAIEESSETASQISLISGQQLAGIEQITEAMRSIGVATSQNAEGARQLEESADEVRTVSSRILEIVQGQKTNAQPPAPPPSHTPRSHA